MNTLNKSYSGTEIVSPLEDAILYEYVGARPKAKSAEPIVGPWSRSRVIEVSVHDTIGELEQVWLELQEEGDATAFQSFAWIAAWQRHIGGREGIRPCVAVGWGQDGKAQFILPLGIQKSLFLRRLVWLGGSLSDYQGPLLARTFTRLVGGQFPRLWRDIRAMLPRHHVVSLGRMPDMVGAQANPFLMLDGLAPHASNAHFTRLKPEWQGYYDAKRSSGSKKRDRQKRRKMEELGAVKWIVPQTASDRLASFDALVTQKSRAFERMGVGNFLGKPGYLDFYRDLLSDPAAADLVHVSHLQVGDDIVAANWGLSFQKRYSYVLASYDETHDASRLGPGMIQLMELMSHVTQTGHDIFDFTIGDEGYKDQWCEVEVPLYDHLAAEGLLGRAALMPQLGFMRLKRFIKQTPLLWNWFTRTRAALASFPGPRGAGI